MSTVHTTRTVCDAPGCGHTHTTDGLLPGRVDGWTHLPGHNPDGFHGGAAGRDYCPDHARMSLIPARWFE